MAIHLSGQLTVPMEARDRVRAALPRHIALTRAEPGCLRFEVWEAPPGSGLFEVRESFRDQAAFEAHQSRTQASDWAQVTRGMARDYQISDGQISGAAPGHDAK